jgi:hypothetical protein
MATFISSAGTFSFSFENVDHGDPWIPLFPSKKYVVKEPVPFAFAAGASEVVQYLGVGNPTSKFTILALDDTTHAQLESLWQQQALGTLDLTTEFGAGFTYPNVALTDVGDKKRRPFESAWRIDVEFTQFI